MIHSSLPCYDFPFSSLHCKFYSDLTCFRSLSSCKIPALPDRESELELAVAIPAAISACQRLAFILDLYRLPMSSVASSVAWRH